MALKASEWMLFTLKMCSIINTRTWSFLSVRAPRDDLQILNGHFRMHLLICMIDFESCCNVVCIALSLSTSLAEQLLNLSLRSLRRRHISACSFTASGWSHFGLPCRIDSVSVAFLVETLDLLSIGNTPPDVESSVLYFDFCYSSWMACCRIRLARFVVPGLTEKITKSFLCIVIRACDFV